MKKNILTVFLTITATFVMAQHWETNLKVAEQKAAVEHKTILLCFSGSDWCIPCMKLEKTIWESKEFIDFSADHYILLRADFPKKKANALSKEQQEENDHLAETYNKQGLFPLVVLLNCNGKVMGTTGFKNISPSGYIAMLQALEPK